ncbi:YbcN family protein [Cronobacter turicensis]|uniref:YbcN family protein n=1 Tax=Cronobacter turicensis TaxID=413502 RepID=UPI0024C2725C|nr:YbcN family protein [Cronobacter turicensis]MDK1208270.1 YbcN family protein [Cronobacter turicensis]MDK1216570.1 YbcN family protein [Cronobacter turicensis]HDI3035775.1 YbcN family protein [Cronobacter turicensis]
MNLLKDGIRLHKSNFTAIGKQIEPLLASGECYRLILRPWRETRSLSQNALAHMWFNEISAYLIKRGKSFATPEWVKDALKHSYLGYEEREMTDVITGEKTTIRSLRHTSDLDTGDMHFFLTRVEAWALSIGCPLTIPADCEYMQLRQKQEA